MISKTASNTTLNKRPIVNLFTIYIIRPTSVVMYITLEDLNLTICPAESLKWVRILGAPEIRSSHGQARKVFRATSGRSKLFALKKEMNIRSLVLSARQSVARGVNLLQVY